MSASSIECVVIIIALSFLSYSINFQTKRFEIGSIPVVGSSRYIIFGLPTLAIAMDNLRFIPPLNVFTTASLTLVSWTSSNFYLIKSLI